LVQSRSFSSILFKPIRIGTMKLSNRFVRSATVDCSVDLSGEVDEKTVEFYTKLAKGGVGLIITGAASVDKTGSFCHCQMRVDHDRFIPGLKRLANAIHQYESKVALQIHHGGRDSPVVAIKGETLLVPSRDKDLNVKHRQMTTQDIWTTIDAFGQAARRAKEAEFDAVELHGAHGYLFSQFLSPTTNKRGDEWGGTLENRMRFHIEVYKKVREMVGASYPVIIKLGVKDIGFLGGLTLDEGCKVTSCLSRLGMNAIEVSAGRAASPTPTTPKSYNYVRVGIRSANQEAYFRSWGRKVKQVISVPLILVGGIRSLETAEKLVEDGYADCISLCRPLIREPGLVNSWRMGEKKVADCVSCNLCLHNIEPFWTKPQNEIDLTWPRLQCIHEKIEATSKESSNI
jgi:2,4-dienoyl-CoA reductase-like NADH-dependent reductase (Old Yellow Enzyme family)